MSRAPPTGIITAPATNPSDLAATKALFEAYVASLPIDIAYQNFTEELATLPGKYASSANGALLLAKTSASGTAIGCVALRSFSSGICEIKRLYITPSGRGLGIGKRLISEILRQGKELGYQKIVLDTLPSMSSAIGLYKTLGFEEVEAYYETPIEGTIFLGLELVGDWDWLLESL